MARLSSKRTLLKVVLGFARAVAAPFLDLRRSVPRPALSRGKDGTWTDTDPKRGTDARPLLLDRLLAGTMYGSCCRQVMPEPPFHAYSLPPPL